MAQTTQQPTGVYEEAGLKEMLVSLYRGMTVLLQQEILFAKEEVSNSVSRLKKGIAYLVAGAVLGYSGLLVLLAAAVIALAHVISLWLSALLIGLGILILGGLFLLLGSRRVRAENLKPHRTIEVVKEDLTWMRNQMS